MLFRSLMQKVLPISIFSSLVHLVEFSIVFDIHIYISTRENILSSFHNNKFITTTQINKIIIVVRLIFLCDSNSTCVFLCKHFRIVRKTAFTSGCLLKFFFICVCFAYYSTLLHFSSSIYILILFEVPTSVYSLFELQFINMQRNGNFGFKTSLNHCYIT